MVFESFWSRKNRTFNRKFTLVQHPYPDQWVRTPAAARKPFQVRRSASTPLGYGGMPTGVVVWGAGRVASALGPCPLGPLPALGVHAHGS